MRDCPKPTSIGISAREGSCAPLSSLSRQRDADRGIRHPHNRSSRSVHLADFLRGLAGERAETGLPATDFGGTAFQVWVPAQKFKVGHRQASLLDKVLHGANAGDLPFERPTLFTLAVNLKAAKPLA